MLYDYARVLSGMRPNGKLHIGNYHGTIKKWVDLQYEHECYFMIADIQHLTTHATNNKNLEHDMYNMVIDWLACGIDPSQATVFIQSHIPQYFELYNLLSIITPLSWLERSINYKSELEKNPDLNNYGVLGSSLLHSTDILLYRAQFTPAGADQIPNIEITREIARRFNYIYGREEGFELIASAIIKKLGLKKSELYQKLLIQYQQDGNEDARREAKFLISDAMHLSLGDKERLIAFLENKSKLVLIEPQILLSSSPKVIGTDGHRMSKSADNTIPLRSNLNCINQKIRMMPTDPARIHRHDVGDPNKCAVWQLHQIYSNNEIKEWVHYGCTNAQIGCLDCKTPLIDEIHKEQLTFEERARAYQDDFKLIKNILADGQEKASEIAKKTLNEVKDAMDLLY